MISKYLELAKSVDKSYYNAMVAHMNKFEEGTPSYYIKRVFGVDIVLHFSQYQTLLRVRDNKKSLDYGVLFATTEEGKSVVFINTFNRVPKSQEEADEILSMFDSYLFDSIKQGLEIKSDLGDIHTFASEKAGKKASLVAWRSWNYKIIYVR